MTTGFERWGKKLEIEKSEQMNGRRSVNEREQVSQDGDWSTQSGAGKHPRLNLAPAVA